MAAHDNLFSCFYKLLINNVELDDQEAVRKIMKNILKNRDSYEKVSPYLVELYPAWLQEYKNGIQDFTIFLLTYKEGKYKEFYYQIFNTPELDAMAQSWKFNDLLYDLMSRGVINLDGTLKVVSPKAKTIDDVKQLQKRFISK